MELPYFRAGYHEPRYDLDSCRIGKIADDDDTGFKLP